MVIYLISKILPLLILPLGMSLSLYLIGLAWKKRLAIIAGLIILYTFSLGVISQGLWRFLETPWDRVKADEVEHSDAIVVLSGSRHPAPGNAQIVEWQDPDRFLAGIDLYKKGKAPILLFTGGRNPLQPNMPSEGDLYIKEAISMGIPSSAVLTTSYVVNTAEEATEIKRALESLKGKRTKKILLVTSAFHMKRAKRIFERKNLVVAPFPVDFQTRANWAGAVWKDPLQWVPNPYSLSSSSRALRELIGRLVYKSW